MSKFIVAEEVIHYHEIEIDDELDIEDIVVEANEMLGSRYNGTEALEYLLNKYKEGFGFDYSVKPDYCGSVSEMLELQE